MLALALWEGQLCRKCGEHLEDALHPDNDPDNPFAPRAWVAEVDECHSCKALIRSERKRAPEEGQEDTTPWEIHTTSLLTREPVQP